MLVDTARATRPGRWDSETGIWMGLIASAFMAGLMGLTFGGWLAWRRRGRAPLRPPFAAPLVLGWLDPLLAVGGVEGTFRVVGPRPILEFVLPILVFGVPVLLAEGLVRLDDRGAP